jgi:hypothetical protein
MSPGVDDRMYMVRSRRTDRGQVFTFPKRDLGKARGLGIGLMAVGVFVTGFMVVWMGLSIREALSAEGGLRWGLLAFSLLGTPGLVAGLGLLAGGLAVVLNLLRSEVVVTADRLLALERAGPLRWTRKRMLRDIERLVLLDASAGLPDGADSAAPKMLRSLAAIRVEGAGMKPLILAPGYPRSLLEPLANQVADLADADAPRRLVDGPEPRRVEVTEEALLPMEAASSSAALEADAALAARPPAKTRVVLREHADGISLAVPPVGLLKGSRGLFAMAVFWNGLVWTMIGLMLYSSLRGEGEPLSELWPALLFLSLFVLVGLGLLAGSINAGRRQAALATRRGELLIKTTGPFRSREYRWATAELAAIRVGPSGVTVNDVPVMELQIEPVRGDKVGLLSQLDDDHLHWIAAVLRRSLDKPGTP